MNWEIELALSHLLEARFDAKPSDKTLYDIYRLISEHIIPKHLEINYLKEFAIAALPAVLTHFGNDSKVTAEIAFEYAYAMMEEYNKRLNKIKNGE